VNCKAYYARNALARMCYRLCPIGSARHIKTKRIAELHFHNPWNIRQPLNLFDAGPSSGRIVSAFGTGVFLFHFRQAFDQCL
jgi:hypothetical protein